MARRHRRRPCARRVASAPSWRLDPGAGPGVRDGGRRQTRRHARRRIRVAVRDAPLADGRPTPSRSAGARRAGHLAGAVAARQPASGVRVAAIEPDVRATACSTADAASAGMRAVRPSRPWSSRRWARPLIARRPATPIVSRRDTPGVTLRRGDAQAVGSANWSDGERDRTRRAGIDAGSTDEVRHRLALACRGDTQPLAVGVQVVRRVAAGA